MRTPAAITRFATGVAAGVLCLSGCEVGGTSAASCVGPLAVVSPSSAAPGQTVQVSAQWLRSGCNDHAVNGVVADEEEPLTDVAVVFEQNGSVTELARVDGTGEDYSAAVDVVVPSSAVPGPARILLGADASTAAEVEITG